MEKEQTNRVMLLYSKIKGLHREKAELKRLKRALKATNEINRLLRSERTELNLMENTCKIIVNTAKYRMCWIGFCKITDAHEKIIVPMAFYGYEDGYIDTTKIRWDDTERSHGPTGTAVKTGKPSICRNMLKDKKYVPWRDEAIKRGYASSIALPLIIEGQVIGAFNIHAVEPNAFDKEEVSLLLELADDLSYGISNIRTLCKKMEYEKELLEMNIALGRKVHEETQKRRKQEHLLIHQSKMASVGELISAISHQWKQPLNGLSLTIQDMKDAFRYNELTEEGINKVIHDAMDSIEFMADTVDTFREFLKPSKIKLEFSVRNAVEEIISIFFNLFKSSNIMITVKSDDLHEAYRVYGYPNEFKQVILNIISNSKDAILNRRKSGLM